MKIYFKTMKGFTIIEMIISISILSILLVILSSAFGSIIEVQLSSTSKSSIDQDGRYIMAKLARNIQNSSSIISPASPGTSTSATLKNSFDSLSYTYSVSNGNLQVASSGATLNLNSIDTSISNTTFTRVGVGDVTDTLQVKFTITSKTVLKGMPRTKSYQTTFSLE